MCVSANKSNDVRMLYALDDFNLLSFPMSHSSRTVLAFPGQRDTIANSLVDAAMHTVAQESSLCERKRLAFAVLHVRRPSARPIQRHAIDKLARGWFD